ncbi:protein CHUP1, chloroplastic isoform X1 [Punica granatum]|uniref:Protein CHUP1, chloroplastic isoform X1 n=1 Tax=Punica granatum TaxID=22663 RepID=A0A6P8DG52_PUNGR|nr:protein CHUP1, chloroplastic isoform X1 [Punica granatum]XP_031395537.1 protein CHUP1, chloroplastic isoform X1 [Punica granatum]XP_031395538.1 protein CHUP1, chloroplastic isoform X1 [Punica granatum]XP_031395539.1 protein CHUP1, chloroplastic isoform X1 [Punica granatum]XP_031395540.1 protein CHUP1, chloroplastic isoform X1 [Punica granatum]
MKQETTPPPATTNPPKLIRPTSKVKDLPKDRARSVPPDIKNSSSKVVRRLLFGRPKSGDGHSGPQKSREAEEPRVVAAVTVAARAGPTRAAATAEQFARPRRVRAVEGAEEKWRREMKEKVEMSENLIKNLECEVSGLRMQLEKARSLNSELESKNQKLSEDLAAAENKIAALSSRELQREKELNREYQSPKFKDIQKLIASKLENPKVMKEGPNEVTIKATIRSELPVSPIARVPDSSVRKSPPPCPSFPPPPPPPPLPASRPRARAGAPTQKAPAIVEFYQFLTKQEGKRDRSCPGNTSKPMPATTSAHSSIVGEIQNRSAHLLAIKADIETKGDFINGLIRKILAAAYTDIEDVLNLVNWLDRELSTLADERAVLKHFNWPERKADAMREAAVEYRSLKLLETEISSFKDNPIVPCGTALKKMANLLDKSERSIQRLIKLRSSVLQSYQEHKIPTDWMLDSGIVNKVRLLSISKLTIQAIGAASC